MGPFTTSMLSMSRGFRSSKREKVCPRLMPVFVVWSARTPSMISSGLFSCVRLLRPRIRTREPAPTLPDVSLTVTFAARAVMRSEKVGVELVSTSEAASIVAMSVPICRRVVWTASTEVTRSPSWTASTWRVKSRVRFSPAERVTSRAWGRCPRASARTV